MEFAERLKTLRKQVKLTQAQIAEKLDISQQAYASWERGVKKPTQENLVKIAQVLNVSIDYLVGNSEEKSDELDNIELLFRMNSKGQERVDWVCGRAEEVFWEKELVITIEKLAIAWYNVVNILEAFKLIINHEEFWIAIIFLSALFFLLWNINRSKDSMNLFL